MHVSLLPEKTWTIAGCSAQDQRDELARFWLAAPEDMLPSLWSSPLGIATKQLVRQLSSQTQFAAEQIALRDAIGLRLQEGLNTPIAAQMLLANFLYSPPGLLRIADASKHLPDWLIADYKELYEKEVASQPQVVQGSQAAEPAINLPEPDFGVFPDTLQELVSNRIQLNRLLGLSNLFYIDPEDQEILQELRQVRLSLIDAINRCPEDQLESIWATDFGDRYWALVRSGIQKEALLPVEEQHKHAATEALNPDRGGGFGTPGAIRSFLVAMILFEPGTMRVSNAEQKLPEWLLSSYLQIFAEPLAPQS